MCYFRNNCHCGPHYTCGHPISGHKGCVPISAKKYEQGPAFQWWGRVQTGAPAGTVAHHGENVVAFSTPDFVYDISVAQNGDAMEPKYNKMENFEDYNKPTNFSTPVCDNKTGLEPAKSMQIKKDITTTSPTHSNGVLDNQSLEITVHIPHKELCYNTDVLVTNRDL
ncbi:uncharacterized protein LOC106167425 [Lingula anatina]|uniref:Uncharacterized protein LOC106167425 n=1 Tax=Lingula anatina TaxID=7574 RepID=A0A2R2MR19_LINAN|nr:uncharacterized protein LOC106167425 [Lingula anatina]|eukprot:XP_023932699.1 uncharacterized protein LOC106167425 [Lingula anatina]